MLSTHRPLGRGRNDDDDSACTVAAWLLSGMRSYGDRIPVRDRRLIGGLWISQKNAVVAALDAFGVPADAAFNLSPAAVRDSYQAVKSGPTWRYMPSINRG